eukprot:6196474-Pleurochrysis_carterae.AAC.3
MGEKAWGDWREPGVGGNGNGVRRSEDQSEDEGRNDSEGIRGSGEAGGLLMQYANTSLGALPTVFAAAQQLALSTALTLMRLMHTHVSRSEQYSAMLANERVQGKATPRMKK